MNKKIIAGIMITILAAVMFPIHATAQNGVESREVTLADIGFKNDETLKGVFVSRDYGFGWPEAWIARAGGNFEIRFSHSAALEPHSSLAVDWNGTRLGSVLLTSSNAENGTLVVKLPETTIQPGFNQLHVEIYMGIHDNYCDDVDNPAVWATIHSNSKFTFQFEKKAPVLDLGQYPKPFIEPSQLVVNNVKILVPPAPTRTELTAVAAISTRLGEQAAWRELKLDANQGLQKNDMVIESGNTILIGTIDRIINLIPESLPILSQQGGKARLIDIKGNSIPPDTGVLWEQAVPGSTDSVLLIVTGDSEKAVEKATLALTSTTTYPRLAGQLGLIQEIQKPSPIGPVLNQMISFENLGYPDYSAQGSLEQSKDFVIPLPMAWQIQNETVLDLHFGHSEIIDQDRSSLNVLLNGTPVGSIQLNKANSRDAHSEFRIPGRLFVPGDNTLTVSSNLQLSSSTKDAMGCEYNNFSEAWLVIYADSIITMPGRPGNMIVALSGYPRAFLGSANLSDLVFVLPEKPSHAAIASVSQISGRLGRLASGDTLYPQVMSASEFSSLDSSVDHAILVGRPTENKAIERLNDFLPQPFKPGTDEPQSVPSVASIVPPAASIGYIETVLTPGGKPRLVVTGNSDEGVAWAGAILGDPALLVKLKGDLAIVNAKGAVASLTVGKELVVQSTINPENGVSKITVVAGTPSWVIWLSAGLILLTVAIIILLTIQGIADRKQAREDGNEIESL